MLITWPQVSLLVLGPELVLVASKSYDRIELMEIIIDRNMKSSMDGDADDHGEACLEV